MKRLLYTLIMLACLSFVFASPAIREIANDKFVVEFELPNYDLSQKGDFSAITLEGAAYPETVGAPALPFIEYKIGVPTGASIQYSISSAQYSHITLDERLSPVPGFIETTGVSEYDYKIDESLYLAPKKALIESLEEDGFRYVRYIPLIINPIQYDGDRQLTLLTKADIHITILSNTDSKSAPIEDELSQMALEQLLNRDHAQYWQSSHRMAINYADFSKSPWWMRIETDKYGMFKLEYSDLSGFPREDIDPRTFRLFASNADLLPTNAINPGNAFEEQPIEVRGEADGSFDAGDMIIFHGKDRTGTKANASLQTNNQYIYHNPFSHNGVYWLTFAGDFDTPPLRIESSDLDPISSAEIDSVAHTVHLEEERHRRVTYGYSWYMSRFMGSTTADYEMNIDLPDLIGNSSQMLTLALQQESTSDNLSHTVSVLINDQMIVTDAGTETFSWQGSTPYKLRLSTKLFRAGSNKITIRVFRNNRIDNILLDYIEVEYTKALIKHNSQFSFAVSPRNISAYAIEGSLQAAKAYALYAHSGMESPRIRDGGSGSLIVIRGSTDTKIYIARDSDLYRPVKMQVIEPDDIATPNNAIESLIITPPGFLAQAEDLAEMYRQKWDFQTKVVTQDAIMNQFNGGHPDPLAIRQYIRHIFHNFPEPKIKSVTLLGIGSLDWRNYSGMAGNSNQIMIYENPSDAITSDDYFVRMTTNTKPEVPIGRYPVHDQAELNIMLKNFRKYVFEPTPGHWQNTVLLLADDNVNGSSVNDWEHTQNMEILSRNIHPSVELRKIFAAEYPPDEYQNKPRVRNKMFDEINEGNSIWFYVGHGSFDVLGMQNYYTGSTDMGRFANSGKLPLFIASSCDVALFYHWAYISLAEKTVLLEDKGGIAAVASTDQSWGTPNHALMSYFVPNLTNSYMPLGHALIDAKLRYSSNPANNSMYVIFGDPNLEIVMPQRVAGLDYKDTAENNRMADNTRLALNENTIMHGIEKANTQTLDSRKTVSFAGSFSAPGFSGTAEFRVKDSRDRFLVGGNMVSRPGPTLFSGKVSVLDSDFEAAFIVPDDTSKGEEAIAYSYFWDEESRQSYISYLHPIATSGKALTNSQANDGPPSIELYLDSESYKDGDTIGIAPMLFAKISDQNGINLTGVSGHNILLSLNGSSQISSVTEFFEYDQDSFTSGTLIYRLPELEPGAHTLQLIVFDNYNLPAVATTNFIAKRNLPLKIADLLIYPNPMRDSGYITFDLSEDSEIEIDIFTMGGRKIRTIKTIGREGFNKVTFDGRDRHANKLSNNSYFVRLKAKGFSGKKGEKTETMVIYK